VEPEFTDDLLSPEFDVKSEHNVVVRESADDPDVIVRESADDPDVIVRESADDPDVIVSELADDPDMSELVVSFVGNLEARIDRLLALRDAGNVAEIARVAHQLKGTGTSYGYPMLTSAAREVETLAALDENRQRVPQALERLLTICRAIQRGVHLIGAASAPPAMTQ